MPFANLIMIDQDQRMSFFDCTAATDSVCMHADMHVCMDTACSDVWKYGRMHAWIYVCKSAHTLLSQSMYLYISCTSVLFISFLHGITALNDSAHKGFPSVYIITHALTWACVLFHMIVFNTCTMSRWCALLKMLRHFCTL